MFEWLSDRLNNYYCQLGEMTGIGATRHLLQICGKLILIDSGVAIARNGKFQVQNTPAGDILKDLHIDLIIITHAHLDHFGYMPPVALAHPEAKIIVARLAYKAMTHMLPDSVRIAEGEQALASRLGITIGKPLFTEQDSLDFLSSPNLITVDPPLWLDVKEMLGGWDGWKIGFHDSGHDAGAMMTFIVDPSDWRYLITGDVCSHDQIFRPGVMLPDKSFCGDFFDKPERLRMITEATHGAKPMTETPDQVLARFGKKLKEAEARNGQVLIPAFSKNRCSKMAMACVKLGYVPYVDGSGTTMMRIELGNDAVDQLLSSDRLIFPDPEKYKVQRDALLAGDMGFHPIITPSGTLQGGHSVRWAKKILPGRNNMVIFPGYLFPESVSRQIYDMTKGHTVVLDVWDDSKRKSITTPVNVVAEVCHFDFTSHDYQGGLVERARLARPALLIPHHCEDAAFEAYQNAVNSVIQTTIKRGSHMNVIPL